MSKRNVGVIGCGVISDIYLKNLTERFSGLAVTCCADLDEAKSSAKAEQYGIRSLTTGELLESGRVDVVLNLTAPAQHLEVSLRALEHGKHVYTEKPLAPTRAGAEQILQSAAEKGLRVGCAPDTFLGGAIQTAIKAIRDGWIGTPVSATAFLGNHGPEAWHANPVFYYSPGAGPVLDMAPYYLTALTAAFGSVCRIQAMAKRGSSQRVVSSRPLYGQRLPVEVDTHHSATLEMENGLLVTAVFSFDIWASHLPYLEIYGTAGTLTLPNPDYFEGPVLLRSMHEDQFRELPLLSPFVENCRGIGLAQMCAAMEQDMPHSASGELGYHVLDAMCAMLQASRTGETVRLTTCAPPVPTLECGILEPEYQL